MGVAVRRAGKGVIVYDPREIENPTPAAFDPAAWGAALRPTAGGRGASWFIERAVGDDWVLRHYLRGGLPGRFIRDRYLWLGEASARPLAEWRLLYRLCHELDLPVPTPVAAELRRHGPFYTGAIITRRLEGVSLAEILQRDGLEPALWRAVGSTLARFHAAGVDHADLNAHNILIDAGGRVALIDFDRGRLRRPGRWRAGNLERLARSLGKLLGPRWAAIRDSGWQTLREAYASRL